MVGLSTTRLSPLHPGENVMRTLPKLLSCSLLALGFSLCIPAAHAQPAPNPRVEARKQIAAAQTQVNEIRRSRSG
jgi:hypothetical protein